jgi:hypothetical protein
MAHLIHINDPSVFQETLDKVSQEQEYTIAIITGVVDPATGKNWCPDCEVAKPNIKKCIIDKFHGKILYCEVDRASWKGTPLHPYKASPFLKVKGVPTVLGILGGLDIVMRAEADEDFQNLELLSAITDPNA